MIKSLCVAAMGLLVLVVTPVRAAEKPHLVMLIGEDEYKTESTLPAFAAEHLNDFRVTIIEPSADDPNDFRGMEKLEDADVVLVSIRRRTPTVAQLEGLRRHINAGKAIVGIRTASHAFALRGPRNEPPPQAPQGHAQWPEFDRDILGGNYQNHHGNAKHPAIGVAEGASGHPILTGVTSGGFASGGSLYRNAPISPAAKVLLMGTIDGASPEPVAWVTMHTGGGRTFYTSLGHPDDFKQPAFTALLRNGIRWSAGLSDASAAVMDNPALGAATKGLDQAIEKLHAPMRESEPLPPEQAAKSFTLLDGFAVDLIAAEPDVRQPLNISFDERGRMWVVQYIQYPFPKGLKIVEYDRHIRAKFDRIPGAPPNHDRGADRITIHEDTDGDGDYDSIKTFVDGLSIATSVLPGKDGVWVMNPPYLLFYPDADGDDVPDADPIVHLSGFGLEDTHSVANSLRWGPDGWIYGSHGSTCTAKVVAHLSGSDATTDFLGQGIWRYHPTRHVFELFGEGGGNTFGTVFDAQGRVYSGTNWGKFRGVHYVQGGRYVKNWGKHGPLTDAHSYGFFEHMPHTGNADRLVHTFVIYDGTLFPPDFRGRIIGPNSLQSRIQVTRMDPIGSTYRTFEDPFLLTSDDGWFRPVDIKVGPDGALYVADFYERRISHVDPRDTWVRLNGRIWRIRPRNVKPSELGGSFDYARLSSDELADMLRDDRGWHRETALRLLAERGDKRVLPRLRSMLEGRGQAALEALWAIAQLGELDEATALMALDHAEAPVRMWTVRLLGDPRNALSQTLLTRLVQMAGSETDPQVRSQLAATARRLSGGGGQALAIVTQMWKRDADVADAHIPLLLWWALEDKAVSHRDAVVDLFRSPATWQLPLVRSTTIDRLARRYADEPTAGNQKALAELLALAPGDDERKLLMKGVNEAFEGRRIENLHPSLAKALAADGSIMLRVRQGDAAAIREILAVVTKEDAAAMSQRLEYIGLLGQVGLPEALQPLLKLAESSPSLPVRRAALAALTRYSEDEIGQRLIKAYGKLPKEGDIRPAAINTLLARPEWTAMLLRAIESNKVPREDITPQQIAQVRTHHASMLLRTADRIFGPPAVASSADKQRDVERLKQVILAEKGDPGSGQVWFAAKCAICHKLNDIGGEVGPDLTGFERDIDNLDALLVSIVDPSAYIREEYTAFDIQTTDGRTLIGLITAREANQITLADLTGRKTAIPLDQIRSESARKTSLMMENLLMGMTDQQVRDLFAYLLKK